MAENAEPEEVVSFDELLMSEVIQSEALINLLDQKGIISKTELLEEIRRVHAVLPKSERVGKKKSKINKEAALEIAGSHAGPLSFTGITDEYSSGWVIYGADKLADCWYVTFNPSTMGNSLGPSYLVAVSKKDGKILFSGLTGGD